MKNKVHLKGVLFSLSTTIIILGTSITYADSYTYTKPYTFSGPCAHLPADRTTEFHGNPHDADLRLGMAGNQWVVFDNVMQGFNANRGITTSNVPAHLVNGSYTLADLNIKARSYYIQLIPPGQIRDQIKSGCMILGNEDDRNFLPTNVQVDFDVFSSTNYTLMQSLAKSGFVTEAAPYIKNKLDLMVDATNSKGIGTGGAPGTYANIQDIVMDLLSPSIIVSEVDHVNEGVHAAINNMYKAMDEYIRENGSADDIAALDAALATVADAQPGSPSDTRPGTPAKYQHTSNADCHYSGHATIADGTLRFCEFSILNKANTHETRVHHVETPSGILARTVDVGPVWTSELKYAQAANDAVTGMDQAGGSGGVSSPSGANPEVNAPATYSIAVVATAHNARRARQFINYVRSADGQSKYTDGGFIGLTQAEMDAGECYSGSGATFTVTPRGAEGCP